MRRISRCCSKVEILLRDLAHQRATLRRIFLLRKERSFPTVTSLSRLINFLDVLADRLSNIVSYATIASSPVPITSATPAAKASSPSLAGPSSYDFKPLLRILLSRLSQRREARPLRAGIGYELKVLPQPPIDVSVRGTFKQYTAEAASRGLVRLGVGHTVGSEWIELVIPISSAKKLVAVRLFLHFANLRLIQADLAASTGDSNEAVSRSVTPTAFGSEGTQKSSIGVPSSSRGTSLFPPRFIDFHYRRKQNG